LNVVLYSETKFLNLSSSIVPESVISLRFADK